MGFVTNLILGRPFMLALSNSHTSYLNFIIASGSHVTIDVQYFYGKSTFKVLTGN